MIQKHHKMIYGNLYGIFWISWSHYIAVYEEETDIFTVNGLRAVINIHLKYVFSVAIANTNSQKLFSLIKKKAYIK